LEVLILPITVLVLLRGVISFFTLFILARALGKKQLSHLSFFEYITGITIGSIAASLTVDLNTRGWIHLVGLMTWAGLTALVQWLAIRNRRMATYLTGGPVVLIRHGRILERNMRDNRYRYEDLFTQLRQHGIFDMNNVAFAVLETNGELSVMCQGEHAALPILLVQEGRVLHEHLAEAGVTADWLRDALTQKGVQSLKEVTVAVLVPNGDLYVDTYKHELA
jgi:uncharacterized membrane protein YcaP (DUF421 family)